MFAGLDNSDGVSGRDPQSRERKVLGRAIDMIVRHSVFRGYESLALEQLARAHANQAIPECAYATFKEALLLSLQAVVGKQWKPRLREAWASIVDRATESLARISATYRSDPAWSQGRCKGSPRATSADEG